MYGAGEASEAHTAQLETSALTSLIVAALLLLVGLGVACGAVFMVMRKVAQPLGQLSHVVGKLASHDEEVVVPHTERDDEIGHMARAMKSFRENFLEMEAVRRDQTAAQHGQVERAKELAAMTAEFEQKIGGIVGAVTAAANQFAESADHMSSAAEE